MKNSRLKSFGISVILLIAGSFILNGCTQPYFPLTPEAEKMNAIPNPDKVSGCSELGEVKTVALTSHYSIVDADTRRIATFVHARGWYCKEIKKIDPTVNFYKDSWIIIK